MVSEYRKKKITKKGKGKEKDELEATHVFFLLDGRWKPLLDLAALLGGPHYLLESFHRPSSEVSAKHATKKQVTPVALGNRVIVLLLVPPEIVLLLWRLFAFVRHAGGREAESEVH